MEKSSLEVLILSFIDKTQENVLYSLSYETENEITSVSYTPTKKLFLLCYLGVIYWSI